MPEDDVVAFLKSLSEESPTSGATPLSESSASVLPSVKTETSTPPSTAQAISQGRLQPALDRAAKVAGAVGSVCLLMLAFSPLLYWSSVHAFSIRAGVYGLSGDGRYVLGASMAVGLFFGLAVLLRRHLAISSLVAECWSVVAVVWIIAIIYKIANPSAADPRGVFEQRVASVGAGAYLGLVAALGAIGAFGYLACRWASRPFFLGAQGTAVAAGIVIAVFLASVPTPVAESASNRQETAELKEKLQRQEAEIRTLRWQLGQKQSQIEGPRNQPDQHRRSTPQPSVQGRTAGKGLEQGIFLGISPDFKVYAASIVDRETGEQVTASRLFRFSRSPIPKIVDLESGEQVTSPTWDPDWGWPLSAAFSNDTVAVVIGGSVKVFSRKTGELEQNFHREADRAVFTADGRFLAITEFQPGKGYHLILQDVERKKMVAEVRLGGNGVCALAVAGKRVAAYESNYDQITVVRAETGTVVQQFKSGSFRRRKDFGADRMPLAISPAGNLLAFEAEDAIVLYDIDAGKITHKLEGHLDLVRAVAFSPDGNTLVSAAKDKTIRFWNVKEGNETHAIKNIPRGPSELIFSADGTRIAIVYSDDEFPGVKKAEIRSVESKGGAR